ncbi:hypothetical protein OE750_17005, partial [Lentibacter sp. XHP0401]|nr:hypothetical protein [Lentibacter sp. XHP0401]
MSGGLPVSKLDIAAQSLPRTSANAHIPQEILQVFAAAEAAQRPKGYSEEYDLLKAEFDVPYYLLRYPDIMAHRLDPIAHYIRAGAGEGRTPHPFFDPVHYDAQLGEQALNGQTLFAHWLTTGRKAGLEAQKAGPLQDAYESSGIRPKSKLMAREIADKSAIPHYGEKLHIQILAAWLNSGGHRYGFEYHLIKPHFDIAYYLTQNPDIIYKNIDPIAHYLRAGALEGRNPTPMFDTLGYSARHPEQAESGLSPFGAWVMAGCPIEDTTAMFGAFDDLAGAMSLTTENALHLLQGEQASLRRRLEHGELGQQVLRAAALEPLLNATWPSAFAPRVAPFNSDLVINRTTDLLRLQARAGQRRAKAVVLVNRPRWGSGRRMEGYLAHALADIYGSEEVIVVTTEGGGALPKGRLPEGVRLVDFSDIRSQDAQKERVLFEFLRSLHSEAVFNINSRTFWEMLVSYGQSLTAETRVICGLFCAEQTSMGFWTGYPVRHFYRHFDKLHGICTDSHALREELCERFLIPEALNEKLAVLSAPVDGSIPAAKGPAAPRLGLSRRRSQIFWAGRVRRQSFWVQERPKLRESLAHLVGLI